MRGQALRSGPGAGVRRSSVSRSSSVLVQAAVETRPSGRAILPSQLTVQRQMGEGSFGIVHQGEWNTPSGQQRVVLKRVKTSVEGAQQMGEMELLLNAYAAKVAKSHIADYLGYCEVTKEEASGRLTPGLWLMWRYEGSRTLHYYLRRRDTLRALASDLEVAEEAVVATVMKQIFEALASFHAAGLVHRDIKPLNIVFAEDVKRFKIIDLGACADLRSGTNYTPDESILDPNYCPPEQYVLPTDSPHLAKSYFKLAISPMLWAQHKPDRFDMWSAGITLLQLAVPAMRQDRVLKRFNQDYGAKFNYNLDAWRAGSYISNRDFEVLDADGGTGWELAKALLRPRSIRTLADNTVVFVNDNSLQRISAGEALRHKFLKQAREPGSILEEATASSTSGPGSRTGSRASSSALAAAGARVGGSRSAGSKSRSGSSRSGTSSDEDAAGTGSMTAGGARRNAGTFSAAVGMWRNLTNKLFDLEANIMVTASNTEKQTTIVQKLQKEAQQGQVSKEVLEREKNKLNKMEKELVTLQDDFNTTATAVGNVLGFLGFGMGGSDKAKKAAAAEAAKAAKAKADAAAAAQAAAAEKAAKQSGGVGGFLARSFASMTSSGDESDSAGPAKQYTPGPLSPQTANAAAASGGGSAGLWAAIQQRMSDLELKLTNQAAATERQVFTVRQLRQRVKKGQADESTLSRAEAILQKMEKRVNELDKDLKQTREEATGLLGMLASSVNQMRGGSQELRGTESGSTKEATKGSARGAAAPAARSRSATVTPAASATTSATPATAPSKTRTSGGGGGGMGGFFNRMFGGGKPKPAPPAAPAQAAASSAAAAAPAAKARTPVRSTAPPAVSSASASSPEPGTGSMSGSVLGSSTSSGSGTTSGGTTSSTANITESANNLIANSLKFTGMAAKVALNMAAAMKADAEKVLKEIEAEAEARRVKKMTEQAFMRMLGSKVPPMVPNTTMAEIEETFGQDPRFLAVEESRRGVLVASYIDALAQAQQRSAEQAQAKLRDLFSKTKLNATWDEVAMQYATDPVFLAVEDASIRRQLFEEVAVAMKIAEEARLAMGLAEQAFLDMLAELEPPVTPDTTWPRVKPLVWRDFRYLAVPENRRKDLFEEMHAMVVEASKAQAVIDKAKAEQVVASVAELVKDTQLTQTAESATPAAVTAASSTPAAAAAAPATPAAAPAMSPSLLDELRKEQDRLRNEYAEMERKLREMEAAMLAKEKQSELLAQPVTPPPAAGAPPANPAAAAASQQGRSAAPMPARALSPTAHRTGAAAAGAAQTNTPQSAAAADAQKSAAALAATSRATLKRVITPGRSSRVVTPPMSRNGSGKESESRRKQEQQVVNSLEAAGVQYTRLKDGTLVFKFDEDELPEDGILPAVPTPANGAKGEPVAQVSGSSNSKAAN